MHHSTIHTEKSNKMQQFIKIYYSIFIRGSTCFGRHTAHHQESKTALAASGFAYVEGCWTCGCWTLSGRAWQRGDPREWSATAFMGIDGINGDENCQFIQKNPKRCNSVSKFIIPYLYEAKQQSLTASSNHTSNNLSRVQTQRLLVQF